MVSSPIQTAYPICGTWTGSIFKQPGTGAKDDAKRQGIPVAFFPTGGALGESDEYIYIYENCGVNPTGWIFLFCGKEIWKLQLGGGFSMIFGCLPWNIGNNMMNIDIYYFWIRLKPLIRLKPPDHLNMKEA